MYQILVYDDCGAKTEELVAALSSEFDVIVTVDNEEAVDILERAQGAIALVLINLNHGNNAPVFLEQINQNETWNKLPILILSDDIDESDMDFAFRMGAIDYITYDMGAALKINRMKRIIEGRSKKLQTLQRYMDQSKESYIFSNCIGAAMILEYDGVHMHAVQINDMFYGMVGHEKSEFDKHQDDLIATVLPQDYDNYIRTLNKALTDRYASCIMHSSQNDKIFRVLFHFMGKNEGNSVFLVMIQDVTEMTEGIMRLRALTELPGTILFDYDVDNDKMIIQVSNDNEYYDITTTRLLEKPGRNKWLSPESEARIIHGIREAVRNPKTGVIDFQGCFAKKPPHYYHWHRAYYRSVIDANNHVTHIIGRVDDVERNVWSGLTYEEYGIYDVTTKLLTYHALKSYIKKILGEQKEGILVILNLYGIDQYKQGILGSEDLNKDMVLAQLADALKNMFFKNDIFGRFGSEGFIFFLPDVSSKSVAKRKAKIILSTVEEIFNMYGIEGITPAVGISIAREEHDVENLVNYANRASSFILLNSDYPYQYAVYDELED